MLRKLLTMLDPDPLRRVVHEIEGAIKRDAERVATEQLWVAHYGAYDIDPRHLVYRVCVRSDAERERLASDPALVARLRELLVTHRYPDAREHVHIGFEAEETVVRESNGNWWHHWK